MTRLLLAIILTIFLLNCSFDNKTGIWDNSEADLITEKRFKDFETLYTKQKSFNSIIEPPNNAKILLDPVTTITKWNDEFYQNSNNINNFSYKNINELIFKSKKLSRHKTKDKILFDEENIIISDDKGNLFVYSIEKQQIIYKYNFYKKKYKKLKKNLSIRIENKIIYVVDNIGFIYAINYKNKKLLWAKNYKIPFRSNLKISGNQVIAADQNNALYLINKFNGEKIKFIPTEDSVLKNDFINSLALSKDSLFYLNTYGSLYSIDNKNNRINWFINLNPSLDQNPSNIFFSNPILVYKKKIIISADPYLYSINSLNGRINFKIPITSVAQPVVSGNNIFLITKDNLLVCIDLNKGNIIYSVNIIKKIANYLSTKEKKISIKIFSILNNNIFVFLNNSYLVNFNKRGKIQEVNKLPSKLGSLPIFVSNSILYLNNKNKLIILN